MSLFFANILGWASTHKALVAKILGCLAALLLLWYLLTVFSTWRSTRQIDKARTNVNIAKNNLVNAAANVEAAKIDVAAKQQAFNDYVNTVLVVANASEAVKANTNAALSNLAAVRASNANVDVTAQQVISQLDELDEK